MYTTYSMRMAVVARMLKRAKEKTKNEKEKTKFRTQEESGVKKQRNYRIRPQLTHPMIYVSGYSAL